MDLGSILIILALGLLAAAFIARPLVGHKSASIAEEDRRLSTLQAERDRVLDALQELDSDHAMKKIIQGDYQIQRATLLARGAEILKAIDKMEAVAVESSSEMDVEAELEAAVARLRRVQRGTSGGFCGACGGAVVAGDSFCSHCGASLPEEEA